uniref:Uncharacterized protein n=1 Tax=Chromera velia CCMP2878 TaxID=1169474 RepID=A0A0G4G2F1_9ALVE|eukprot:Cvel_19951.t1-p1 / transcript=Cvel_19951.t1 / gene=Cvel_19951 / organism=Chromera_velia_CCMP2878 / gene_product=hypothetical protein / transcript_product=hypothetical protein / location=Cvel_scaffold1756:19429-19806(+) / protein_length=126 / sequence_SO=supercontig / SO=protein_coding / is_pseudo=false
MKCPDCGHRGGHDEGSDCPGQQKYCMIYDALGKEGYYFEQCYPLGRERKNARGKTRGRGGPLSMRGGTTGGEGGSQGMSAMMTSSPPEPPFPWMKAMGIRSEENPTFRVGEVLGKAGEETGLGDSW